MGNFGRISEYRYYRYFCQSIDTILIPIFYNTSHHYWQWFRLFEKNLRYFQLTLRGSRHFLVGYPELPEASGASCGEGGWAHRKCYNLSCLTRVLPLNFVHSTIFKTFFLLWAFILKDPVFWRGIWRCTHASLAPQTPNSLAWDRLTRPALEQGGKLPEISLMSGNLILICLFGIYLSDGTFHSLRWYSSVVHVHQNKLVHWTECSSIITIITQLILAIMPMWALV